MRLLRRRRYPEPRQDYMTQKEHFEEAERLAWVVDHEVSSPDVKRTLAEVIALAQLHLALASDPRHQAANGTDDGRR